MRFLWIAALLLGGCDLKLSDTGPDLLPGTTDTEPQTHDSAPADDQDRDGYLTKEDCDDEDPAVNPGAAEAPYDGKDNDCDESTPDDDLDGDGYGIAADCDDYDNDVYPGAEETCDEEDNDCDESVDEGVGTTYYADSDGDGTVDGEEVLCQSDPLDAASVPEALVHSIRILVVPAIFLAHR